MVSDLGGSMAMTYEMTLDWLKNANVVVQVQILEILKINSEESNVELSVKTIKKLNQSAVQEGDVLKFLLPVWITKSPPPGRRYFILTEVKINQLIEVFLVKKSPNDFKYLDGMFIQSASDYSQYINFLKTELDKG